MPFVPANDASIRTAPLPAVRVNPNQPAGSFGGAGAQESADEARRSAHLVAVISQEERERADDNRLSEFARGVDEWEYQNLYEPEKGAVHTTGVDAIGIANKLRTEFTKYVGEQSVKLTPTQRVQYEAMTSRRLAQIMTWAGKHEGNQQRVAEDIELQKAMKSHQRRAAANPFAPVAEGVTVADEELGKTTADAQKRAKLLGLSPGQATADFIREAQNELHTAVMISLLREEPGKPKNLAGAKEYFDKVKGSLDPESQAKIGGWIKNEDNKAKALEIERVVFPGPKTLKGAIAEMDRILDQRGLGQDAELRKITKNQIEERYQLEQSAIVERHNAAVKEATRIVDDQAGGFDWKKIPAEVWGELTLNEREQYQAYSADKNRALKITTNPETLASLKLIAAVEPERFMNADGRGVNLFDPQYKRLLSTEDWQKMIDVQAGLLKGDREAHSQVDTWRSVEAKVNGWLDELKIDDKNVRNAYKRAVDFLYSQEEQRLKPGEKVKPEAVDDILIQLGRRVAWKPKGLLWNSQPETIPGYINDILWADAPKYGYEAALEADADLRNQVMRLPPDERRQIEQALRDGNRRITPAAILQLKEQRDQVRLKEGPGWFQRRMSQERDTRRGIRSVHDTSQSGSEFGP